VPHQRAALSSQACVVYASAEAVKRDPLVNVGFVYGAQVISKHAKKTTDTSMYGVMLMLGYLGFDGFTSTFQDKLFKGYKMETYNQMLYVNLTSATVRAPPPPHRTVIRGALS
jgi:hypothetical protein